MKAATARLEGFEHIAIRLVHPGTGKKVRLRLRQMSFEKEADSLPRDLQALHKAMIQARAGRNASIYRMVFVWNRLRKLRERYWEAFGFNSDSEYLAYYGLPDGMQLAKWTAMVVLFDKATFTLVGDQVLSFLMAEVAKDVQSPEERKLEYQQIFDQYCNSYTAFDKYKFFRVVRSHMSKKYAEQERPEPRRNVVFANFKRESKPSSRRARKSPGAQSQVKQLATVDAELASTACSFCSKAFVVLRAYERYTNNLESIIISKLGEEFLPSRPDVINNFVV